MSTSMFALFRNRFIRAILMSGFFLQVGIWVRNFSVLLFVVDKTHADAFAVSMISVAEFLPIFLFSFIGGTFADRWRPKRTMVWCDLLSAVSIVAVLLALTFSTWRVVFFATLASSILSQFSQPSGMKLFKLHVPEELMQEAMSLYQTLFALFMILGPALGTFVYQHYGIKVAIGVMGAAFLLSAGTLTFLPPDRLESMTRTPTTLREEMVQGVRYVLSSKALTTLGACFAIAGLALGLIQPLGIFIVTERLGLAKENLQWFMMANGIAMIVGGGLTLTIAKKIAPPKLFVLGMITNAVCLVVIGWSTQLWLSLAAQFVNGLVLPGIQISINTMILRNSEQSYVGRVNGILNPLFIGSMVVTMSIAGWLKQSLSLVTIYEFSAVLFFTGVFVMLPMFRLPMMERQQEAS